MNIDLEFLFEQKYILQGVPFILGLQSHKLTGLKLPSMRIRYELNIAYYHNLLRNDLIHL